jgi:hypothetical protein
MLLLFRFPKLQCEEEGPECLLVDSWRVDIGSGKHFFWKRGASLTK